MTDFLLNPNIVYILLVAGLWLAILAVLTPGTGIFEFAALLLLGGAAWGIWNLPVNIWALVLLVLGVIPFLIAVRKSGNLIYLGIAIVALVVGSAYLFQGVESWLPGINPLLALFVSVLSGGYLWIITVKILEAERERPTHDLSALIGAIGEAKTEIFDDGSVQVRGELWSAESDQPIPTGSYIRVIDREGFTLKVERVEKDHHLPTAS